MATAQAATWPGLTGVPVSGLGFDTCTVPSVTTMTRWLASPFRVAGTYLGGDNWACGYGNFSRSWVTQVAAEGWRFIPIWVGPQAPCSSVPGAVAIDPYQAGAEGRAQAASAVATAAGFGYGKGTPIYFDMEGYDNQISSCRQAVLDFLSSWTQALHAAGYRSGVYSSASSGVADLASQYGRSGYSSPDDIWFAEWNGDPVVADSYLPGHTWPNNQRLHQFDGPNVESFGGTRVNIDDDFVDGAVAGLSMPPGPYVLSQPDAVSVARHMPGQMQLVIGTTATSQSGTGATVQWQVHVARGLTVTPDQGSATAVPGKPDTITLHVAANSSAKPGRYNLPVTATVNGQSLTGTYELVSVRSYEGLPTARPVVLYAADNASMQVAYQAAHDVALPIRYLTGSFSTAWDYAAGGKAVLIAVGQAAVNALYSNPCGWSNPAHARKGSTPFVALGGPLDQPPGTDYFENSADSSASALRLLTGGLAHYALTGTLPNKVFMPSIAANPTGACLGSSSIRVP